MTQAQPIIAILGGGSFGTAIANIAAEFGVKTHLWMRSESAVKEILETRENSKYLPELVLHENLLPTSSLSDAVECAQAIFFAIPSKSFRDVVEQAKIFIRPDQYVISTTKGIEPGTLNLMSDILRSELPSCPYGVMGGPNLAKEIAKRELTATVIASQYSELRKFVQDILGCAYFNLRILNHSSTPFNHGCGESGVFLRFYGLNRWRNESRFAHLGFLDGACIKC